MALLLIMRDLAFGGSRRIYSVYVMRNGVLVETIMW